MSDNSDITIITLNRNNRVDEERLELHTYK